MDAIEETIRGLVVCLMKTALYFSRHGKVIEATSDAFRAIRTIILSEGKLVLGIRERQLIYKGEPLYEVSLYAVRLIDALLERHAHGLSFEQGLEEKEVLRLIEFLSEQPADREDLQNARKNLESKGVVHISLESAPAETTLGAEILSAVTRVGSTYQDSMSFLQQMVVDTKSGRAFDVPKAQALAENIVNCVGDCRDEALSFTAFKDYDEYTYNHSVNVCMLTVALAKTLTQDKELLVRIGEAALLHDVGKVFIPEEVLYKPGKLTDEEYAMVKTHSERGARFLAHLPGIHSLSVSAALGHHLGYDLSGYPVTKDRAHLDPVTMMINLIDVYEALISKRPYKNSVPCDRAAAILIGGAGTQFNPSLVHVFIRVIGLYPPGARVQLESGETAVVKAINPLHLDRPKVMVISDREGSEVSEPYPVDTCEVDSRGGFVHNIEKAVSADD